MVFKKNKKIANRGIELLPLPHESHMLAITLINIFLKLIQNKKSFLLQFKIILILSTF